MKLEHNVDIETAYYRNPVFNTGSYNAKDILRSQRYNTYPS